MKINKEKKKIFAAALILLFFTVLGISLLNTNPTLFLGFPTNNNYNQIQPAKSYTGNGTQLNSLLYITNNTNSTANDTNTDDNIYIQCPNGWKIVWANLTLTNINAPNVTIEPNASTANDAVSLTDAYAMSFQLTNDAYLDSISVQLTINTEGTANFWVYNATNNGSGVPKPQNSIKKISDVLLSTGTNYWKDIDFGHVFLNTSTTYDKTFFIIAQRSDLVLSGYWRAITDDPSPGAGRVYYYTGSDWSSEQAYDCKLKVNVSASTAPAESAEPSEIGLTINVSQVSDISKGNGAWINSTASSVSTGYIFYDVNSTWMSTVSFSYIWNVTYGKGTTADTNFVVNYNSDAFWNVTVDATDSFPLTDYGVNHINITGVPIDWGNSSSMAYNQTGTSWTLLDSYPPQISFLASNGTWIVNCTAPNYVSNIGFEVDGAPVENATLYDNLNITVNFYASVSGTANLSIYDPSQILNHTDEKPVSSAINTWFTWDVSDNATDYGSYNTTVRFKDGLAVGYNETSLEIVALTNTSLTVTSYLSNAEYPGPVPIGLYYRADGGPGLAGADITAYFENSTVLPIYNLNDHLNGSYSFDLDFGTDFNVQNVRFNASGLRLFNSNISNIISINYTKVLVSISLNTPSSVILNTTLAVYAHLWYTTSNSSVVGQSVNFNFSIRFNNGTSIILQSSDTTNDTGWATGTTTTVPIDTIELNVTAYYDGTGTVSAATSSTNSITLTSGGVSPSDTGLVALMFLMMTQQNRNFVLYLLLAVVVGVVALVVVAANRVRMSHEVPLKAMASLENIIVDHIPTGSTLWAFDFFKMEQDVTLVSGFMSAVKSFMGEMQKGGLRKLETEFGTFIREDGALLTATCITCGNTPAEENWIRQRLRSFLSIAEQQHLDALQKWSGDVAAFRKSFPKILASVIDLDKTEELQRQRVLKLENDKERLQAKLNNLGSELESLNQQFEAKEISKAEFEAREARIEPQYDKVQKEYIHVSLCLSRVPPKLEVTEDVEKIQESFLKIRMEIEELRRKEQEGTITSKDLKRRDKLQKELMALIEKLDKLKK